jgi:hypothetical protein
MLLPAGSPNALKVQERYTGLDTASDLVDILIDMITICSFIEPSFPTVSPHQMHQGHQSHSRMTVLADKCLPNFGDQSHGPSRKGPLIGGNSKRTKLGLGLVQVRSRRTSYYFKHMKNANRLRSVQ